ncbi:MAG: hypothetical protein MSC31_16715 [Solirubrobacteraceae bacterium MAG38_C4-C5]|nr:hypothetical protein [Candidatus Siliceabacter maunaloa]
MTRPITPQVDKDRLCEAFERLGVQSRYRRLRPMRTLSQATLRYPASTVV